MINFTHCFVCKCPLINNVCRTEHHYFSPKGMDGTIISLDLINKKYFTDYHHETRTLKMLIKDQNYIIKNFDYSDFDSFLKQIEFILFYS